MSDKIINHLVKKEVLGVDITSAKKEEVLEYVFHWIHNKKEKLVIVTPNPEILIYAAKDEAFKSLLNQAQIALPDGVGIMGAARILGEPLKERITGVDFMELICKNSSKKLVSIGLFGGKKGVAKRTSECLLRKYPGIQIAYATEESEKEVIYSVPVDFLFVGLGAPKQEEFIFAHLDKLPIKAAMGVGGTFDYISGEVRRAPLFIRRLGLEWLFRLIRQPWRAKRQLALICFMCLVCLEKLKMKK